MNLKKYFNYARNLFKTKPKENIMKIFHNLSASLKEKIVYDENYSKRFFKENKSLFENEPDIKAIQERFEDFFWNTQKEYEVKVMRELFHLREYLALLPDEEIDWFTELYVVYESEIFKYLNELHMKYTQDLKNEFLEYLVLSSIEDYVTTTSDQEDEEEEIDPKSKKRYQ